MTSDPLIAPAARAITSLAPAVGGLEGGTAELEDVRRAAERGYFTPAEDERVRAWFARYLTAREGLLEVIGDLRPNADGDVEGGDEATQLRCFVLAYAAACVLVRAGRYLVGTIATHRLVQRKLNEPEPRFRIPPKQYTAVYRSLTSPANAWRLREAIQFAESNRTAIDALADDPTIAPVLTHLREAEDALRLGVGQYVKARLRFRWHSLRRRRASATQQVIFSIAEAFGRVVSEVRNPLHVKRVDATVLEQIAALLEPGDVVITRRDHVPTNLFLPGFWPHASLHLGPARVRTDLGVEVSDDRAARWVDPIRMLEARKDGVLFRELADTLAVDAVAVIRPRLSGAEIARGLSAAISHEGKLYNFDFDFFRADRLVCTEVVYRAYDGLGPLRIDLKQRAGRLTLSAEDLLDLAVDGRGFLPVAVYGAPNCRGTVVTGDRTRRALAESYDRLQPEPAPPGS